MNNTKLPLIRKVIINCEGKEKMWKDVGVLNLKKFQVMFLSFWEEKGQH